MYLLGGRGQECEREAVVVGRGEDAVGDEEVEVGADLSRSRLVRADPGRSRHCLGTDTVSSVRSISVLMAIIGDDHRCSIDRESAMKIAM
jgi:hypothetical protein